MFPDLGCRETRGKLGLSPSRASSSLQSLPRRPPDSLCSSITADRAAAHATTRSTALIPRQESSHEGSVTQSGLLTYHFGRPTHVSPTHTRASALTRANRPCVKNYCGQAFERRFAVSPSR